MASMTPGNMLGARIYDPEAENCDPKADTEEQTPASVSEAASVSGSDSTLVTEHAELKELSKNKGKLAQLVHTLRKDLADWRSKVCVEMRNYQAEVGNLKEELSTDLDKLKQDYAEMRAELRARRESRIAQIQALHLH